MAIEANIRKRKHAENTGNSEDSPVPKKLAKKSKKSPKVKKTEENNEEQIKIEESTNENAAKHQDQEQDSGFEEKRKFSTDFKMLNFRAKLRGTNFITEIRHFLYLTEKTPKIIAKYIEKRGKPLELAEALERIDKTNILHVSYICHALQLVIMEILSNQPAHMESAISACRYFLKTHGMVLDTMLQSPQLQLRKIALKLLTAIVCAEPQVGRQLLASFDILSNATKIERMLSHSKIEINETETVRKCYIHFVLSYLVEGNTMLIRNILDKGVLIRALVSGLLYDDHVTVCMVLNTLKKYVLECPEISKTKKINVFDLECCKLLVRLYEWRGPKVFAKLQTKDNGKFYSADVIYDMVEHEERDAVCKVLHEFMIILLTSRKYGIAFDGVTHFRMKHNSIQGKLMGSIFNPWRHELKADLCLKILKACPELGRATVRNFAGIINPIKEKAEYWLNTCAFLDEIITTLNPKLLQPALEKLTLTDFGYWIKDICLPLETLVLINATKMLSNPSFKHRMAINRLLLTMFRQYSNFLSALELREKAKTTNNAINSLRRFRFDLLTHLMNNFPTVEHIMVSLYQSISNMKSPDVDVLEHLDVSLDLVLLILKENSSFVNKTATILKYLDVLRPFYAITEELPIEMSDSKHKGDIKLELKAIKTILMLSPKALEPHQKLFKGVLTSFISAYVKGSTDIQEEAGILLREIFKNTGLFDSCLLEIDLWLEPLKFFDSQTVDVVTQVMLQVLQVTDANVESVRSQEAITNEENLHKLFENIENGLSVQAYIETLTISKLMPLIFKGVTISAPLDKYLETVCLLMFHYYPSIQQVQQLYGQQFKSFKLFMQFWSPTEQKSMDCYELPLNEPVTQIIPHYKELNLAFLNASKETSDFAKIFKGVWELQLHDDQQTLQLSEQLKNPRMLMIYAQQILFMINQLREKQQLQKRQAELAADYLIKMMRILQTLMAEEQEKGDKNTLQEFSKEFLHYIFAIRLNDLNSLQLFDMQQQGNVNYVHFLRKLAEKCNEMQGFEESTINFRLKCVKAVEIACKNVKELKAKSDLLQENLALLKAFKLQADNCWNILLILMQNLKYNDLFDENNYQKTIFQDLIILLLQRLAELKQPGYQKEFIKKFAKLYIKSIEKFGAEIQMEHLEDALYAFLHIYPQHLPLLTCKFFAVFFVERKISKSSIKLAGLMMHRCPELQQEFIKQITNQQLGNKKELIYPLLNIICKNNSQPQLEATLLQLLYQEFKNGFMKTIEKPQKAGNIYKENVEASIALIKNCMPHSECVDFCNKQFKFDGSEHFQIRLIHAIYEKAIEPQQKSAKSKQLSNIFINFINIQLQLLNVDLKKSQLDSQKLELIAFLLSEWFKKLQQILNAQEDQNELDYDKIIQNSQWQNYTKMSLKLGMSWNPAESDAESTELLNASILKLLAYLCQHLYEENSENPQAAQLFEMINTHSKFYDIMLNAQNPHNALKTQLIHLMYVLASKSPQQCFAQMEIPVLLGAYQAKLHDSDCYALALLQLCEQYDSVSLQQYRPFIWGESAVSFYALRLTDEAEKAKLSQQETSIEQVMSLIDSQVCDYTLNNFPVWRKLNACSQLPAVIFNNPYSKHLHLFGNNDLEKSVESAQTEFTAHSLRLCPKRAQLYQQCYDPAFVVPLMSICFAPESYAHTARPVQNGLLSVCFAALSSQDKDMRLAAACVQLRYRSHFENSKFFEKPLWIQAYDNIQAGLAELRSDWMKHKKNSGTPRVPFISGLFIAKTFNLTTDPTHLLYKQLTMYLRLKSTFNFQCIPEFNILFYSPEIEHHSFRQFIVEVIRNGLKSSSDLFLLVTTNTFKVLQGFYGSSMSTLDMNLLILSVFSTCVKIPASAKIMIEHVGVLSWLCSIISTVEFYHFDIIEGLISIINNLWYSLKATENDFHNFAHLNLEIHRLILSLLPHLSPRISTTHFAKLMNIFNKTSNCDMSLHSSLSSDQLERLIGCTGKHYPEELAELESIKAYGGAGTLSQEEYCKYLHEQQKLNADAIVCLSSLRSYIKQWWEIKHKDAEIDSNCMEDLNETKDYAVVLM